MAVVIRVNTIHSPKNNPKTDTQQNIEFLNNPAKFTDRYLFRITFDCPTPLPCDIEWKLIFISCPDNESLDQELDSLVVGPIPQGINQFSFDAEPPDPRLIRKEDVLGISALIFTGSYKDQEFVRVGYYQNTEYDCEEMREQPPEEILFDRLVRDIYSAKPRVTRFQIRWYVLFFSFLFALEPNFLELCRDVGPSQSTDRALGAANSAPVPSADDILGEDDPKDRPMNGVEDGYTN